MKPSIANIPLSAGQDHNNPVRIIVHAMAEFIDLEGMDYSAHGFLKKIGLSAHALITPTGVIIKCRDEKRGAYHAKGHNTNTLGVEFLVPGLHTYETFLESIEDEWVSDVQLDSGIWLIKEWIRNHQIQGIKAHSEIDPDRKYDPGDGFPLSKLLKEVDV